MKALGHDVVALQCSDDSVLTVCLKCGHYTGGGHIRKLREECRKPRDHKIPRALSELRRGRHPKHRNIGVEVGPWFRL